MMFGLLDYLKMAAGIAAGVMLYHVYAVTIGYPSAAREAREGYVLLSEKTAAEATAEALRRQLSIATLARDAYSRLLDNAEAEQKETATALEQEISSYELQLSEKNRSCVADAADRDWLLKH